jgi:hypothetical protein
MDALLLGDADQAVAIGGGEDDGRTGIEKRRDSIAATVIGAALSTGWDGCEKCPGGRMRENARAAGA